MFVTSHHLSSKTPNAALEYVINECGVLVCLKEDGEIEDDDDEEDEKKIKVERVDGELHDVSLLKYNSSVYTNIHIYVSVFLKLKYNYFTNASRIVLFLLGN